jgi:flagellar hook assembly protein FlgD
MATNQSQGVVKLEWNPTNDDHTPSSAITYNLVVYKNDSPVIVTSSLPEPGNVSNSTQWTITNLADGDYIWSLKALDASFTASVAATGSFTAGTVHTDLRNTSERGYSIGSIYPNPCIDQCRVSIAIPETCRVTITISDISGKKILPVTTSVYNAGTHEIKIDGSNLTPGIYLCNIKAGNPNSVQKLIVTSNY